MEIYDNYIYYYDSDDDSDALNGFASWHKNNALSGARRNKEYLIEFAHTEGG